jgi:predicted RecA/RadA family phage recombinase
MTVSTADRQVVRQGRDGGLRAIPVAADTLLPHGRPVFIIAASGLATNTSTSGANKFGGIAYLKADNRGGAAGDISVEVYTDGAFELVGTSFTQASVGKKVYLADNGDGLTVTSTNATLIGSVSEFISSTLVAVEIDIQPA